MNWNSKKAVGALLVSSLVIISQQSDAQVTATKNGQKLFVNTITTAVPFLRINNDTRSGGMGDIGIATSADAGGAQLNGAKMAFIDKDFGVSLSFTPWLKSLVDDIYLANLSGFYRIKGKQTVHASLRFFSLGQIQFKDINNQDIGQSRPQELAVDAGYSRKLGDIFSVGITLRFIYSNIAAGIATPDGTIQAGVAGAGDISWLVHKTWDGKGNMSHELYVGMNISNIGSKISYTASATKDFIPTNLGIGLGYVFNADKKSQLGLYLDVNRLLVPTPVPKYNPGTTDINPKYDANNNGVADYREVSPILGIFKSFGYAPGGSKEKLKETTVGVGLEYMYKKMFGVRLGYYYEDPTKGARQYLTVGATLKYSVATLHLSYLVPTTTLRNPLDNTFRFTLNFEFMKGAKKKAGEEVSTPSEPLPTELKPQQKRQQLKSNNPASEEIKKE